MAGKQKLVERPTGEFLFVVNGEASTQDVADPPYHGEIPVRRRPHIKSRRGCLVCKQRRVKCDEHFPCSNCLKRHEKCIRPSTNRHSELNPRISQSPSMFVVDNTNINLLHLELFSHFQRELLNTLAFSEIWQDVLQWSFQEPYIMCPILCLAATHLSILRPQSSRYSNVAIQLLSKSAALFSEKLSGPVTPKNSEALIAASILMHYISWGHFGAVEKQESFPCNENNSPLTGHLSKDPLLQLSYGVQGILHQAFHILHGSDSVFLATGLYTPVYAIEEAIRQLGGDPWRFVDHFMEVPSDLQRSPLVHDSRSGSTSQKEQPINCLCSHENMPNGDTVQVAPQAFLHRRQVGFEKVAKRLSLLFCLISLSSSTNNLESQILESLQPDIERCLFSFPVHYSQAFRGLALEGDPRALIMLCHFYRAARILLNSPRTWWARQRSRIIECLILKDLSYRGLDKYVLDAGH
ncbi:hypothetical protein F5Y03DRAFT_204530 [Xylaria venustula]|nr:hypothetical protein F5Y03DRAFT_204530 [Xylaria venustula]